MPNGHKIALFGTGHIGRAYLTSGVACLSLCKEAELKEKTAFDDILKLAEPADYKALVRAYRKVQRKYYPEKDVFKTWSK